MKKIALSLSTIAAVMMLVVGATSAYFTSNATVNNVTFATGTLEIRVNGQPSINGANFINVAPGEEKVAQFNVNNANAANFGGQSTLAAKSVTLNVTNPNDYGSGLWQEVYVMVEDNAGWSTWQQVYWGKLKDLANVDLLGSRWAELAPGNSIDLRYTVWLPETNTNQNALMGKTMDWDWSVEGRTN